MRKAYELPDNVQAIVNLIGAGKKCAEDVSRTGHVARLVSQIGATGSGLPVVFLNGESEELENMVELAVQADIPPQIIRLQDCGRKGEANTKTQFQALKADLESYALSRIVLVTSTYHVPRVARTAVKHLPPSVWFTVVSDLNDIELYDWEERVGSEIERIIRYVAKGDISAELPA
ncbi:MAG: ElyC/SanA/YdcF family protein [Candidatus Paceibacterota bacterium]|nr:MAG: ElyC/SanA/YdcF family protein [Candidatus Paceibacterota bacterium]